MEAGKELIGLVKDVPQVLTLIYSDLAQPGVKKVGTALETVLEFSTSFLLPVKLLNEKFKLNFEKRLDDYKEKLEDVPESDLCEVNPQIGTPIIDKLSYTTNDEIADLFTSLLTKASSIKTVNLAHPSFVQLIERLSVDEARIIKHLINKDIVPSVSFRAYLKNKKGFQEILKSATSLHIEVELFFPLNINTYLDNLVSMGILDNSHGMRKIDANIYEPLYKIHNYVQISESYTKSEKFSHIEKEDSYFQITDFGKTFIRACSFVKK